MAINADLFRQIADHIDALPHLHAQDDWGSGAYYDTEGRLQRGTYRRSDTEPCGTAFCIAGWAAHIKLGIHIEWEPDTSNRLSPDGSLVARWYDGGGNPWMGDIEKEGRLALGLDYEDAAELFSAAWNPRYVSVPQALRAIADGASISEATWAHPDDEGEED